MYFYVNSNKPFAKFTCLRHFTAIFDALMISIIILTIFELTILLFSGFFFSLHIGQGQIIQYDSDDDSMPDLETDDETW